MPFINETEMELMITSEKAPVLETERDVEVMKVLLENQAAYLAEAPTQVSGDIASFTKILTPAVRRIFPGLFAKELVSIQPLSSPTGYAYAQRYFYKGNKTTPISSTYKILTATESVTGAGAAITEGDSITSAGGATGTVKYIETEVLPAGETDAKVKIVVEVTAGSFVAAEEFDVGAFVNDGNEWVIAGVFSSQAAFRQILTNYSGSYATDLGESLGDTMNQVGFRIDKVQVEAKTRKLKSEFSVEMIQDLSSQHGMNAESELLNILQFELQADIDREILAKVRENATVIADIAIDSQDGTFESQKFAVIYTKVLKACEDIAIATKRGAGNVMVTSPAVIAALSLTNKLKFSTVDLNTTIKMGNGVNVAYVGTLDNGVKVYRDTFAVDNYVLVAYKGATAADAGAIFAPYTPLMVQKAVDANTLQPVVGVMSRYGIVENPLVEAGEANPYYQQFVVDFTGTTLA